MNEVRASGLDHWVFTDRCPNGGVAAIARVKRRFADQEPLRRLLSGPVRVAIGVTALALDPAWLSGDAVRFRAGSLLFGAIAAGTCA
jgi:hypothetical protein